MRTLRHTYHKPGERAKAPPVLISILSYNSAESTFKTVGALRRQTYPNIHLQVIDNASTDNCAQRVAEHFPDVVVRQLPQNIGYTGSGNVALTQAFNQAYEYAVVCNHDIEVDEFAIERLVQTAETCADAGVVGAVEYNTSLKKTRARGGGHFNLWLSRLRWLDDPRQDDRPRPVESVHGALLLFTARALNAGIRFDENLFMYLDEADLGFQLNEKGLRAVVDQRVIFNHLSKPYQLDKYVGYLSQRNRLYMTRKHGRWHHIAFYSLYSVLLELPIKAVVRTLQGKPRFALACIAGHIDGLRGRADADRVRGYIGRKRTAEEKSTDWALPKSRREK